MTEHAKPTKSHPVHFLAGLGVTSCGARVAVRLNITGDQDTVTCPKCRAAIARADARS
jgi:hypothetical protein